MWYYNNEEFDPSEEDIKPFAGFVYVIEDKSDGKKYVGKKTLWSRKKLPPLKGKKRKRLQIRESDWRTYYGSSDRVKQLLEEKGEDNFYREILHFCKTKGEMGYLELKEQMDRKVLLNDEYLNGIIQVRIHRSHVQSLKDRDV